ncbi:MAG: hypothetical protein KDH88_13755 [Chromatiales bacterium]|nr:hypothetical protein [Chromatiales bacterium]
MDTIRDYAWRLGIRLELTATPTSMIILAFEKQTSVQMEDLDYMHDGAWHSWADTLRGLAALEDEFKAGFPFEPFTAVARA